MGEPLIRCITDLEKDVMPELLSQFVLDTMWNLRAKLEEIVRSEIGSTFREVIEKRGAFTGEWTLSNYHQMDEGHVETLAHRIATRLELSTIFLGRCAAGGDIDENIALNHLNDIVEAYLFDLWHTR